MHALRYWTLVLALVTLALVGHTASAQDATPAPAGVVLPPDAEVAGLSLAEWKTRWWQWFESLPEASHPLFDETGERCSYGQSGPVFFLASAPASVARTCTVPRGVTLLVPVVDAECSTVEPPPFFGRDEAELRACAVEAVNQAVGTEITAMEVRVDGEVIEDLAPYRVSTPLFPLVLPPGNLLGTTASVADSVADGYQVLLAPLPEGEHVITISVPGSDGPYTVTYQLRVAAAEILEPVASQLRVATPQILEPVVSPEASPGSAEDA
jgi:hypothetical protein